MPHQGHETRARTRGFRKKLTALARRVAAHEGAPEIGTLSTAFNDLPQSFFAAAVGGVIAFFIFEQLLSATLLALADPARDPSDKVNVWAELWDVGWRRLWIFLVLIHSRRRVSNSLVLIPKVVRKISVVLRSLP